jgi:phosphoserine phosphatase RsbU/P
MKNNNQDQRIEELLLLQRVAQRINSILDLDVLLEEVVTDVAQTFGYSRSGILFKDEKSNELVIAAVSGWTVNFHVKGDRFKIGEYGIIGQVGLTEQTYYAPDVTRDPYYQVSEESTKSELDIPLKVHGKLIGVFSFQHKDYDAFPESRIQLLEALAGHVATAIENARLFRNERKEKDRMARELEEARAVQRSLFPNHTPELSGFEISGLCVPCYEVGGDWFDYIPLGDGKLGLVLADISGKGMAAALLMASTRSILRSAAIRYSSPAKVLNELNVVLIEDFPKSRFVTMIYAVLDPISKTVTFANAGHHPPLISDGSGVSILKFESALPLGIKDFQFSDYQIKITPGSRLLFYSDGISEAMDPFYQEFGTNRLIKLFTSETSSVQNILEEVQKFCGDNPASDDITLLMIKAKN